MGGWSQVRETRTIHAGTGPGPVIRGGLMDKMLADLPVSVVFFFARPLGETRLAPPPPPPPVRRGLGAPGRGGGGDDLARGGGADDVRRRRRAARWGDRP